MKGRRRGAHRSTRVLVHGEQGETLLELLMTITIMGIMFVAVLMGVATAISASTTNRDESTAEGVVRAYADRIIDSKDVAYVNCATTSTYATPPGFTMPTGWTASVTNVAFWQGNNPPTFAALPSCVPANDNGLQQLTLRVQSPPGGKQQATETLVVVKRR